MPWSSHIQSKHLDPVWSPLALAADALKGPVGFRSCHCLPSGNPEMGIEITWNDIFKHLNKIGYSQYEQFPSISINFPWPGLFGAVDGGLHFHQFPAPTLSARRAARPKQLQVFCSPWSFVIYSEWHAEERLGYRGVSGKDQKIKKSNSHQSLAKY